MEVVTSANQILSLGMDEVLQLSHLDYVYHRAEGNHLFTHDGQKILDLVQGAGTGLLGHNHQEIIDTVMTALGKRVPQNAQFSSKPTAKRLVEKISKALGGDTGSFVGILANSGTEAVEIALKHATYSYFQHLEGFLEKWRQEFVEFKRKVKKVTHAEIPLSIFEGTALSGMVTSSDNLETLSEKIETYHNSLRFKPLKFIALKRAFHGKTLGSLRITYNIRYRYPFLLGEEGVYFVSPEDISDLEGIVSSHIINFYYLSLGTDLRLNLKTVPMSGIGAFIYEPVQGEGGIFPLTRDFLQAAQDKCHQVGIPVIADEIQTFGRLGHICVSKAMGLDPDYLTLAKGLGGGICKIAMALIRRQAYQKQFDLIHSSTFAGDELSSLVALKTIDILTREDNQILNRGCEMGKYFIDQLLQVKTRYPKVIYAVRGAGLMIGIEFFPLEKSTSWVIRQVSHIFNVSSLPIASYLLNKEKIRVLSVLSDPNTIRIEPSLYIEKRDIDHCVESISRLCEILNKGDGYSFIQHHLEQSKITESETHEYIPSTIKPLISHRQDINHAAFLCHPVDIGDFIDYDPSLRKVDQKNVRRLLQFYERYFNPELIARSVIKSSTGLEVQISFIALALTSQRFAESMARHNLKLPREKIREALDMAYQMRCSVCGLGQYTSIVTRNGLIFDCDHLSLTTGNALTAGMAIEALLMAARERGLNPEHLSAAVVGAGGNIGSVISELLSDYCPSLLLIGSSRYGSKERLLKIGYQICNRAYNRVFQEGLPPQGFSKNAAVFEILRRARPIESDQRGKFIYDEMLSQIKGSMPLRIEHQMQGLRDCQLIITAVNTSSAILYPENIRPKEVVICDVGVPANVHESVRKMYPNVEVIEGGLVELPHKESINIPGNHLFPGTVFACIAETILLAMEGFKGHYSYGPISSKQVTEILHIAAKHGFKLAKSKKKSKDTLI